MIFRNTRELPGAKQFHFEYQRGIRREYTRSFCVIGRKMLFPDDLDIAAVGTIWFSEASTRFDRINVVYNMLEGSATGRLISYAPATSKTRVELDGLFFANGVALEPADEYVLVTETGNGRIHRRWLKGDRKGQRDLFFYGLRHHNQR